jgi:hypothetical protein
MSNPLTYAFHAILCLGLLSSAGPASADPIVTITSGQAHWIAFTGGRVDVSGTEGFRLVEGLSSETGAMGCCFRPGDPVSFNRLWSGLDTFVSNVSLRGRTYTDVNGMVSPSTVILQFTGTVIAPRDVSGPTTVSAPFTATGEFVLGSDEQGVDASGDLVGRGVATVSLQPDIGEWFFSRVDLSFQDIAPAPIPEPGSVLLTAIGLLSAGRIAMRERKKSRG